jgi:hypothetical protein
MGDTVGSHGTGTSNLELRGVDGRAKKLIESLIAGDDCEVVSALDNSAKSTRELQRKVKAIRARRSGERRVREPLSRDLQSGAQRCRHVECLIAGEDGGLAYVLDDSALIIFVGSSHGTDTPWGNFN